MYFCQVKIFYTVHVSQSLKNTDLNISYIIAQNYSVPMGHFYTSF